LNVAFALIAAGAAQTVAEGLQAAARSIDSGAALEKLRRLREVSAR
jgi:anthranilate phosphoribosyltransferase